MATKMTQQNYIDYVYRQLGGNLLEVEIKEMLPEILVDSLGELKEYLTYNKFVTVPYAQRIDLSAYKVRSVIQVMRTQAADSTNGTAGTTDAFLLAIGMMQGVPYDITRYANLLQIRQLKNTISTDLQWVWDDPYLYVTQNAMQSAMVTIEYTPVIESVEEITDDYWIGKLKKLFLANAKIITGRVRSKYRLSNALYDNDGPTILAEGNSEKAEVMKFLQDNSDIILPIG